MKTYAMKTMAVLFAVMVGMFAPLLQGEAEQVAAAPPSGDSTAAPGAESDCHSAGRFGTGVVGGE